MTLKTNAITFTLLQTQKLAEAMVGKTLADEAKTEAFKVLKRKVPTIDDIPRAKEAFNDAAMIHGANYYKLSAELFIHAMINGVGTDKIKGVPVRTMRDYVHKNRDRWMREYGTYLKTGEVAKSGGKAGTKKRATKGAVNAKGKEPVVLTQAPDTTPLKRAIEQVSCIPRMVLDIKPSQFREGLRQEIEIAAMQLGELLGEIK